MGKLEGKIALVTGGNGGIGLAAAKQFVNEGAYVFITGRREQELAVAVKEIGRNVTHVQGDVSNLDDLDRLFSQIKRDKGRLDIVFANAGVAKLAEGGGRRHAAHGPSPGHGADPAEHRDGMPEGLGARAGAQLRDRERKEKLAGIDVHVLIKKVLMAPAAVG